MIARVKDGNIVLEMPVRSYLDIVAFLKQKEGYRTKDGFSIKETQAAWRLRLTAKLRQKKDQDAMDRD